MSEWGTHPISPSPGTVGSQSTDRYCREQIHCTTLLHHCITLHQHCIKSPTHCTTLPMMHNYTSHWGQYKPDRTGKGDHHTPVYCLEVEFAVPQSNSLSFPRLLEVSSTGLLSQDHNRIHTVQEGSQSGTTNHCKNYLVINGLTGIGDSPS